MNALDRIPNEPEDIPIEYKMESNCGCGGNKENKSRELQETKYQCPMNCEGNKTYNQPGNCPVCNMQLVMVGMDEPRIVVE